MKSFLTICTTLLVWTAHLPGVAQQVDISALPDKKVDKGIRVYRLFSDTLFNSPQQVSILKLPKKHLDQYDIRIGYSATLQGTSDIAKENNAVAAVNGSFFNRDQGGSVTYHENQDEVMYHTVPEGEKWAFDKELINGAIIIDKSGELEIREAKPDTFYEKSPDELSVLVSGPLLLQDKQKTTLPGVPFVQKRHPRTCLCETETSILLITIDGRSPRAAGMNLHEAQRLMQSLGCEDAINLDGGGSVTMWGNGRIINTPSDKAGERDVANAVLIVEE